MEESIELPKESDFSEWPGSWLAFGAIAEVLLADFLIAETGSASPPMGLSLSPAGIANSLSELFLVDPELFTLSLSALKTAIEHS